MCAHGHGKTEPARAPPPRRPPRTHYHHHCSKERKSATRQERMHHAVRLAPYQRKKEQVASSVAAAALALVLAIMATIRRSEESAHCTHWTSTLLQASCARPTGLAFFSPPGRRTQEVQQQPSKKSTCTWIATTTSTGSPEIATSTISISFLFLASPLIAKLTSSSSCTYSCRK